MVYLDNAATAQRTENDNLIIDEIVKAMKESWYNPSSLYSPANKVRCQIEEARKVVADYIGAEPEEIYFTGSASEANNWVIQGFLNRYKHHKTVFLTSTIEHKSITECANAYLFKSEFISVDKEGGFNTDLMKSILELYPADFNKLVSVQFANNELGTIQDIKNISSVSHEYGCLVHTDAVQAVGKIPINVKELGVDMLTFSGHKLSPVLRGIGVLYMRKGVKISPLIYGAQERGLRGGTESAHLIMGLKKAIELQTVYPADKYETIAKCHYFLGKLRSICDFKINGSNNTIPNIISITFKHNIMAESLLYMLDLEGVAVSTGSACNSHDIEGSRVLRAIGLSKEDILRTIRISFNENITYEELDIAVEKIGDCIKLIEMTE